MEELAKPAIKICFERWRYVSCFLKSLKTPIDIGWKILRDWNISRQLLWGQQIPAYYYGDGKE